MLFKDPIKQKAFTQLGYCVLNLLPEKEVATAVEVFDSYSESHNTSTEKFRGTGWINDPTAKSNIDDALRNIIEPSLQLHFNNFQTLGYGFLMKEPTPASAVDAHQDWTYVDESQYSSMNVWIALEDITEQKGCMWVVPRSHRVGNFLRPAPNYAWPYKNITAQIETYKQAIPLKTGQCLCFNNKLIHGSFTNAGNTKRLAAVTTVYPASARLLHYYIAEGQAKTATEYAIEKKTFLTMERGLPPRLFISSRQVPFHLPVFSATQFKWEMLKLYITDLLRG